MPLSQLTAEVAELRSSARMGSFSKRIMRFTGGIVIAFGLVLLWATDHYLVKSAIVREVGTQTAAANRTARAFASKLETFGDDAHLLAALVAAETRDLRRVDFELWLAHVSGTCYRMLDKHSDFLQVRILGEFEDARELVRWDRRTDGTLVEITGEDLQAKGARDYAQRGFTLPPGSLLVTDIDLNREHGQIVTPDTPVLRVVCPVPETGDEGERLLAILNVDLSRVFRRLAPTTGSTHALRVYDDQGQIVLHPEEGRAFAWDHRRPGGLLIDDFPSVTRPGPFPESAIDSTGERLLIGWATVDTAPDLGAKRWHFAASHSYDSVIAGIRDTRLLIAISILGAVALMIVTVGVAARRMVAPLNRLTDAVTAFGSDGEVVRLPSVASRELVYLSKAFAHMRAAILTQKAALVKESAARTAAQRTLEKRNRDLETLFFITSHDLREPLRAIRSFSEIVLDRAPDIDARSRDFLRRIRRAGERMDSLMDDLLQLSRAQREAIPDCAIPSAELVKAACEQNGLRISSSGAKIRIHDDLPSLYVHRTWVTQAFANLIGNALKFAEEGSVPEIDVMCYRSNPGDPPGPGLVFADRGPGIEPGQEERIFILFQRGVPRDVEGTGTGLAIVREVAHRHGGHAWVRPRAGGGSEFIITFAALAPTETAK